MYKVCGAESVRKRDIIRVVKLVWYAMFVYWKVIIFFKVNSGKINYFSMFGSVMKNKLENTFQCLVM
jgi:hypothetical protein